MKNKFKETDFDKYYLCGPEEMIQTVSDTLSNNGVSAEKVLFELFTASNTKDEMADTLDGQTHVEVLVDDETFSFAMSLSNFGPLLKAHIALHYAGSSLPVPDGAPRGEGSSP